MFGYLRPMRGELKVCDFERFKACYCGLCRALGKKYGFAARFTLNYESVFLAMLLWDDGQPVVKRGRCIAGPCRSRCYCGGNAVLEDCAGYGVILAYWKLRDDIADESFVKSIPSRLLKLFLSGAYRRATRRHGAFAVRVKSELAALAEYEAKDGKSLDEAADKFASILRAAADTAATAVGGDGDAEPTQDKKSRILSELLYHLGRWLYIVDACDDYSGDLEAGQWNAVAAAYPSDGGGGNHIHEETWQRLRMTVQHSNNLVCSAFELLPENAWSETLRNTLYIAMPDICERVTAGEGMGTTGKPAKRKRKQQGGLFLHEREWT
jgi:hypothetical protein